MNHRKKEVADLQYTEDILKKAYASFNIRDINGALATMHADVDWPNGMEGGIEHGHEAVRSYWTKQWALVDPHVEPLQFEALEDGRIDVTVHQIVHDREGKLLVDKIIHHIYSMKNGLITSMEINDFPSHV